MINPQILQFHHSLFSENHARAFPSSCFRHAISLTDESEDMAVAEVSLKRKSPSSEPNLAVKRSRIDDGLRRSIGMSRSSNARLLY